MATFYVGSFTKIDTTTTQAITGVGFQPDAVIFWTAGSNAASTAQDPHIISCFGYTSGSSESYCVAGSSEDNVATTNTAGRIVGKAISLQHFTDTSGAAAEADLQSFDTGGFTLNWTTNTATVPFGGVVICYLAIGDVDAKVAQWTQNTGTGAQQITGIGFKPTLIIDAAHQPSAILGSQPTMYTCIGAYDGTSQFAVTTRSSDNQAFAFTQSSQHIDGMIAPSSGSAVYTSGVSLDSNGFTVNRESSAAIPHVTLCLRGVQADIGYFEADTTGNLAISGVGFEPEALLLMSIDSAVVNSGSTDSHFALGASDGSIQRSIWYTDVDVADPSNNYGAWYSTYIAPIGRSGSFTSFDSDGFTISWSDDALTPGVHYIALASGSVADAGSDQVVDETDVVTLDSSSSAFVTSRTWTQISGPTVTLSSTTAESPTFTAPYVDE